MGLSSHSSAALVYSLHSSRHHHTNSKLEEEKAVNLKTRHCQKKSFASTRGFMVITNYKGKTSGLGRGFPVNLGRIIFVVT
mgnify:CR=1 FL=1